MLRADIWKGHVSLIIVKHLKIPEVTKFLKYIINFYVFKPQVFYFILFDIILTAFSICHPIICHSGISIILI